MNGFQKDDVDDLLGESREIVRPAETKSQPKFRVNAKMLLAEISETVRIFCSRKILHFIPQMIWTGACVAYWSGSLVPQMSRNLRTHYPESDDEERAHLATCFEAMMIFGVGQTFAGIAMGKMIDVIGSRKACAINVIVLTIVTTTSLYTISIQEFSWVSYLNCFFWGLMDGCVSTHSMQIVGFEFADCTNPFAVYQAVYSFSIFVFLLA